ncbi:MAG: tetraacyldisaccharide 4'-kinase [Pelagibacterales bacterium]|nr:tetraacyldisaccharide 4'-kinase [Pelagibacterales bacterium]
MKTPKFWYSKNSIISILLRPISFLWVLGSVLRKKKSYNFNNIKIIKVGNVVAGGSGKTPTVISIVKKLANSKYQVHIISRGYKGSIKKSTLVNTDIHSYKEVGDESIILSKIAPTWIGNNRIESIKNAQKMGAKIVVLDDGIQDASIKGDLNLLVFNGLQGLGNGKIIPAGPLREKLSDSIKKCHLSIIIDEDINNIANKLNNLLPIIKAKINIESEYLNNFKNKNVVAFCGLGFPEKFFKTIKEIGCNIRYKKSFPDHYQYKEKDLKELIDIAIKYNSLLITTEKDHIKILKKYRNRIYYFPITVDFINDKIINDKLYSLTINK